MVLLSPLNLLMNIVVAVLHLFIYIYIFFGVYQSSCSLEHRISWRSFGVLSLCLLQCCYDVVSFTFVKETLSNLNLYIGLVYKLC